MEIERVRTEAPVVQLTVTFAAPPERLYAAWVDPGAFREWFMVGDGFSTSGVEIEPRELGSFRATVEAPDGEPTKITGRFVQVVQNAVLRLTWTGTAGEDLTLLVLKFEPGDDGGCRMQLTHGVFGSEEDREVHEQAWTTNLASLDSWL